MHQVHIIKDKNGLELVLQALLSHLVHNLRLVDWHKGSKGFDWAYEFDDYIYENIDNICYYLNDIDYSKYRWTLDTKEDFILISEIYNHFYNGKHDFYLDELVKFMQENPKLYDINKDVEKKYNIGSPSIIKLRKATYEDCYLLFDWANDDAVRANSFNSEKIDIETHKKWLEDKLQDKISHTLITFGLTKEESMNFKGENRVIALIENDNLEHENNYEENGIINYEVNSKKSKDILGYLVRRNKNCIIIFKDIDKGIYETLLNK